jgi:hypothetical protein
MSKRHTHQTVDTDLTFHRHEWRIQRIGWGLLALFLALALAGLFGNGPLSHVRAANAAGSVEYERFARSGLSTDVVVTPARTARGVSRVAITADYLEAFRVEHITPEPSAVRVDAGRLVYEFAGAAPDASIVFHIHPQRLGRHTADVIVDGGAPLAIRQFTYP